MRNLLPQHLGYEPGTSLIGSFLSTEKRFRHLPLDGKPEPFNPGPGAYPVRSPGPSGPTYRCGREVRGARDAPQRTPGVGAYETYSESRMLDETQSRWPGEPSASAFSANAARKFELVGCADSPGPGRYRHVESSLFSSRSGVSATSPYTGEARWTVGSKLGRAVDTAPSSSFVSRVPAHGAWVHPSGAATAAYPTFPGPGEYAPPPPREPSSTDAAFVSSESRFQTVRGQVVPERHNPGPGAHTVKRWDGQLPPQRRPRSLRPEQRDTGFLCRSVRMASAEGAAGSSPTDTQVGEAVVAYLATGPLGPAGSGRYRVAAAGAQRGS